MNTFYLWSDDALRDGMRSGHISEWSGLQELERRHPSPSPFDDAEGQALVDAIHKRKVTPTPKDVFA